MGRGSLVAASGNRGKNDFEFEFDFEVEFGCVHSRGWSELALDCTEIHSAA